MSAASDKQKLYYNISIFAQSPKEGERKLRKAKADGSALISLTDATAPRLLSVDGACASQDQIHLLPDGAEERDKPHYKRLVELSGRTRAALVAFAALQVGVRRRVTAGRGGGERGRRRWRADGSRPGGVRAARRGQSGRGVCAARRGQIRADGASQSSRVNL